jgi:hypothetical protein
LRHSTGVDLTQRRRLFRDEFYVRLRFFHQRLEVLRR